MPPVAYVVSWTGICPGKRETAGISQSALMRKGNRWLRRALTQAPWAARRKKNCYLAAQFPAPRPPPGGAAQGVTVAHSILILTATYFILRDDVEYQDLGSEHFHRLTPGRRTRNLFANLRSLAIRSRWRRAMER
jgi:transposase